MILKMATGVDKNILTYGHVLAEVRVKRRKDTERGLYWLAEQLGKQYPKLFLSMIRTVQFKSDTPRFIAHFIHETTDFRCIEWPALFYMFQKIIECHLLLFCKSYFII